MLDMCLWGPLFWDGGESSLGVLNLMLRLREGRDRSQPELEIMGKLGIRFNTLLLSPHWTDSSVVGVSVATITLTLW